MIQNFECPYCGVLSQMFPENNPINLVDPKLKTMHNIEKCNNCSQLVYFITKNELTGSNTYVEKIVFHYPTAEAKTHESVPKDIADTYKQGVNCLNVGSSIGAITCFRRALQQLCIDKGATQGKMLHEQLDEVLTARVKETAHEIKQWGNLGAHPDELIQDVKIEDAEETKDFMGLVFEDVYVVPWKIEESKKKRGKP